MSTGVRTELRLSAVEMDACWELLRLGDTPLTLTLPSPGRTYAERDRLLADVRAELARRGLGTPDGPGAELAGLLQLVAVPQYQVDLRLGGEPYGDIVGIGAARGEQAVVVFRRDELVRLIPVRAGRLIPTLLGAAGRIQPGAGRGVNIPADVYDDAQRATTDGRLWTMADELTVRGVSRAEATGWVRMCSGVRSFGQLGTVRVRDGAPRFGPWVIGFHRTDAGHFLQLRRPDGIGTTVTVAPVDGPRLHRLTRELLAAPH